MNRKRGKGFVFVIAFTIITMLVFSGCNLLGDDDDKPAVSLEPTLEGLRPIQNTEAVLITNPDEAIPFFSGAIEDVTENIQLQFSVAARDALRSHRAPGDPFKSASIQPAETYSDSWDEVVNGPEGGTAHTRGRETASGSYSQTSETPPFTATFRMNEFYEDTTSFDAYRWNWTGGAPAGTHQLNGRVLTRSTTDMNGTFIIDAGENLTGGELVLSGTLVLSAAASLEPVRGTGKAARGLLYVSATFSARIPMTEAILDMFDGDESEEDFMDMVDISVSGYIRLYNNQNEQVGTKNLTKDDLEVILGELE